jgi:hypothetical protein
MTPQISFLIMSRDRPELFSKTVQSIINTCSNLSGIEILLKLDSDTFLFNEYNKTLLNSNIKYKILTFDRMRGWLDIHTFDNELAKLAQGLFLWHFTDDIHFVDGFDWFSKILETRNIFADNIYNIRCTGNMSTKTRWSIAPIVTREWYNIFGCISPMPSPDLFFKKLNEHIRRMIEISEFPFIIDLSDKTKEIKMDDLTQRESSLSLEALKSFSRSQECKSNLLRRCRFMLLDAISEASSKEKYTEPEKIRLESIFDDWWIIRYGTKND